ncbi:hypothetical protein ACJJTC_003829 [Scirpophaga incertulas]
MDLYHGLLHQNLRHCHEMEQKVNDRDLSRNPLSTTPDARPHLIDVPRLAVLGSGGTPLAGKLERNNARRVLGRTAHARPARRCPVYFVRSARLTPTPVYFCTRKRIVNAAAPPWSNFHLRNDIVICDKLANIE